MTNAARCNVVHYGAILTVVLAGAFFAGPWMASAETIRFEDMRKGTQVDAAQCSCLLYTSPSPRD